MWGPQLAGPATTEVMEIPDRMVGAVIGTGGATITEIQRQSGARVKIEGENTMPRKVTVSGPASGVAHAVRLIEEIMSNPPRIGTLDGEVVVLEIPHNRVGVVIGRSGEYIREIMQHSGAQIQVSRGPGNEGETRSIFIQGSREAVSLPYPLQLARPVKQRRPLPVPDEVASQQHPAPGPAPERPLPAPVQNAIKSQQHHNPDRR